MSKQQAEQGGAERRRRQRDEAEEAAYEEKLRVARSVVARPDFPKGDGAVLSAKESKSLDILEEAGEDVRRPAPQRSRRRR